VLTETRARGVIFPGFHGSKSEVIKKKNKTKKIYPQTGGESISDKKPNRRKT